MSEEVDLNILNESELLHLIRRQTGLVVKRSVGRDRLMQIVEEGGSIIRQDELSPTNETRKQLQLYIEKNWVGIQSQLPCKGENRGRCTIYGCPEGRHVDCYLSAKPHMRLHDL